MFNFRRRLLNVCVLTMCVGSLASGAIAQAAPRAGDAPTISEFLKVRTPNSVRVAPDGSVYMRDWPDGVNQLYRKARDASPADQGKRLTNFTDGLSSYAISPDGKWIVLSAASGGSEQTDLHLLNTANDQIKPLFENPNIVYDIDVWLHDSSGFIYHANDESPRDFYIYHYDLASGKSRRLLARPGSWQASDITRDGQRLLVGVFRSISDGRTYELNAATGELTDLSATPENEPTLNTAAGYLPGEDSIVMASDFQEGMRRLYIRSLKDPKAPPREALPDLGGSELEGGDVNRERTLLATVHNENGYGTMRLFRLPGFEPVGMPNIPEGIVSVSGIEGDTLVYSLSNAQTPGSAFAWSVGEKRMPRPLTTRMDQEKIDLSSFRLPMLVKYKSFDGLEIPAFLFLPQGAERGKPVPFVVNYHGGPEGQSRPGFNTVIQYLVARGYGVMLPNVRGSTGYGREFHMLDNYKNRWDSVKDGVEAARWLVDQGYAQKGRISAYGGSYGGFMSVATIVEGGDLFGASINVVGIVNFRTFLEQTKGYRQALREAEYGPLSDSEFLEKISPITYIDRIKIPMMIAHGLNDPRVPVGEAMQLAVGLQRRGYDPELLFFPDEGHGFAKLENRIVFYERMVRFLDQHIGAGWKTD